MTVFLDLLKTANINKPDQKVLAKIRASFASELLANIDSVDSAVAFYREIKLLPSTITKAIVLQQLGVLVNGPLMHEKLKLLTASREDGRQLVVKMLYPDSDDARPLEVRNAEIRREIQCCKDLVVTDADCALVPHEVVTLSVPPEMEVQTRRRGDFTALLMPRYLGSVARGPTGSMTVLSREARRLVQAIRYIHSHGYIHMDVKADNVFYDIDGRWFLGDFGSACKIGTLVSSTTEVFYPDVILGQIAEVKYDWFMLLVMLLIEVKDKEKWHTRFLDEGQGKVSYALVMNEAQRIIEDDATCPCLLQELRSTIAEIVHSYVSSTSAT